MASQFRTAALALTLIAGVLFASPSLAKTLNWAGCGITKKAFMTVLADAFEKKTGHEIELRGGGATRGIQATATGETHFGGSCRPAMAGDPLEDVRMVQVAWDALAVITHPSNPVENISGEQLQQVFEGKINNWKALGGPDQFILVGYRSKELSGVGYSFRELGFRESTGAGQFTKGIGRASSGPLELAVESLPNAIAVTGVSSARKRDVKLLEVDGIQPSPDNIATGRYPFYRPLYLTVPRNPAPEVKQFVDFALSQEGQRIIREEGTVNLKMGRSLNNPWGGDRVKPAK